MNDAAIITTVRHVETIKPPSMNNEPPREHWCLHRFTFGSWGLSCFRTEEEARSMLKFWQSRGEPVMPHIYKVTLSEPVS